MSEHFKIYAHNLNRVHLAELLDHHAFALRVADIRPSLITNPLTGRHYTAAPATAETSGAARHC